MFGWWVAMTVEAAEAVAVVVGLIWADGNGGLGLIGMQLLK